MPDSSDWTPASGANLHQPVPRQVKLEEVLCVIEPRAVGQDWCVTYDHRLLQIHPRHQPLALAGKRIQVLQGAEGRLQLRHQGRPLSFTELARRPVAAPVRAFTPTGHTPWQPGPSHPWNRSVLNPRPDGIRSA
jgi:hypothetical protein